MAAISSLAADADSIVTVLLFSFCRKQGTKASRTISIWRLETHVNGTEKHGGKETLNPDLHLLKDSGA